MAGVLALGVLGAIAILTFMVWPNRNSNIAATPSIAVLAFDDLSNGEDRGYLSDAISEGIITELSRFSEIRVMAHNSSFRYRDAATDIRDIGKKLGATYVLEGSQQKYGNRLRVTYQLVDAASGNHILAGRLDRDLADLFVMQDEIVRGVATAVGREVSHRPPPLSSKARVSALHYHLQAMKLHDQFSRESNAEVLRLNLLAVEADPTAPFGYIGLVYAYGAGYRRGWTDLDPDEAFRRARQSAEKAVKLDPANYGAHRAMAWVHNMAGEPERAIARYRKAIELNPSASDTMAAMSMPLMSLGRFEEAIATIERAARIDPHYPDWFDWNLSWAQYILGNCETALRTYRRMANPSNLARRTLAAIYVCLGRQAEAEATIVEFLEREPDYTIAIVRTYMEREYKKTAAVERWMEDLRIARLPE
jgi:TolB-like protein/Tfp pilus assembly protein PilF